MAARPQIDKITLSYLRFQSPKENRGNVITFLLLFMDLFGVLPIIAEPFSYPYFIAAVIPAVIIHMWAIFYIIAPYKFEQSYYLFMGVYAVVNTYVYFLVTQKLLYLHIGITSSMPFVIGLLFFIGLIVFMNWLNFKALYSGTYDKLQKKTSLNMSWVAVGTLGYTVGQVILTFAYSESVVMMVLVIAISLLSVIISYFTLFIHRYFFIRKNIEAVKQVHPTFGLSKKERESGEWRVRKKTANR